MNAIADIAGNLGIRPHQVQAVIDLLGQGNTIPFIARYRKEATGELDEVQLREVQENWEYHTQLQARKEEVHRLIGEQGKLTPELEASISKAEKLQELEDLYRPFRPKRKTRGSVAREKGLAPLAEALLAQQPGVLPEQLALGYIGPEVPDAQTALDGARDILAEDLADDPRLRELARGFIPRSQLTVEGVGDELGEFALYAQFSEEVRRIPPHRVLAINRGEKEKLLKVRLEMPEEQIIARLETAWLRGDSPCGLQVRQAIVDGFSRLLAPSLEREVRAQLTEKAQEHAIGVFQSNLRPLLLQPPLWRRRILGVDPAYRTGCKLAAIDETGRLLGTETIYPHAPQNRWAQAKETLISWIGTHAIDVVAIGNGTASRETEKLVAEALESVEREVGYALVSEAGASVYSASPLAKEELPNLDVSLRGAVSIARRLQDPLPELVKIDPRSIGVGLYQHDLNQGRLGSALGHVVEDCVHHVGVDLNTASPALLSYISGISPRLATGIVARREEKGAYGKRKEIMEVKGLGEKAFQQAAGFLRLPIGQNPLEATPVHPESYRLAEAILAKVGLELEDLRQRQKDLGRILSVLDPEALAQELGAGVPTIRDILEALSRPGRDPREDLPQPVLRRDVLEMADLREGMILTGTVRNVVDFGAFVDIGVKKDGLIHISEMGGGFVSHPADRLTVGEVLQVRVKEVDQAKQRIALSLKEV